MQESSFEYEDWKPLVAVVVSAASVLTIDCVCQYKLWRTWAPMIDQDLVFVDAFQETVIEECLDSSSGYAELFMQMNRILQSGPLVDRMQFMVHQAFASLRIVSASSIIQPDGERKVLHEIVRNYLEICPAHHRAFIDRVGNGYVSSMQTLIRGKMAAAAKAAA